MVNRSVAWADWHDELLTQESKDIEDSGFDIALTCFDSKEIDDLLASFDRVDESDEVTADGWVRRRLGREVTGTRQAAFKSVRSRAAAEPAMFKTQLAPNAGSALRAN